MKYKVKINNTAPFKVDLTDVIKKLKPYFPLVSDERYPLVINIGHRQGDKDQSYYDIDSREITLKINPKYAQSRIDFIFAHEFFHFIQQNSKIVYKATSSEEEEALYVVFEKVFHMSVDQVRDVFHDFMPREVEANTFAAMITGAHYKRHKFSVAQQVLKDKGILEMKKTLLKKIIREELSKLSEAQLNGPKKDFDYTPTGMPPPPNQHTYNSTTQAHATPYDELNDNKDEPIKMKKLSDFAKKYNVQASENGKFTLASFDGITQKLPENELHDFAYILANIYLGRKVGLQWDDLADMNSLYDYIEIGMAPTELFNAAKEAANERLSDAGYDG